MAGYGDDAGLQAWLADNGYTLPVGAPLPAILRQRASTYVDGLYGSRFVGVPAGGFAQERAWPRSGATVYGSTIPDDVIPLPVIQASYAAALQEANEPGSLSVTVTAIGTIKREKTDVLETEYFAGSGDPLANATPTLSAVEGLLAPFLVVEVEEGSGFGIWAIGGRCA